MASTRREPTLQAGMRIDAIGLRRRHQALPLTGGIETFGIFGTATLGGDRITA